MHNTDAMPCNPLLSMVSKIMKVHMLWSNCAGPRYRYDAHGLSKGMTPTPNGQEGHGCFMNIN